MKRKEKMVPYVIKGDVLREEVKNTKFEIRNTKQEEAFRQFSNPISPQSQLCRMTTEDSLLRLFFFLKPHMSYQPVEEYPLVLSYPFLVDYDEKFLSSVHEEPVSTKVEETTKKQEESEKRLKDLTSRVLWKFFTIAASDKQVRSRLQRRRLHLKGTEVDDIFSSLVKRRKKQFETIGNDLTDVYSSTYYSREYYVPLIQAFKHVEEAKENMIALSSSLNLKDLGEALSSSLSKLIRRRIFRIRTFALCMECTLKKGFEPFSMGMKYPVEPPFVAKCEKCGGKTIFHGVEIEAPYTFGPLFKENRLPEFIIGSALATSDKIRKVYVHKKIQVIAEKGPLKGHQIDIFAITRNEKILIFEITTSKDLNRIWEHVHKREKSLNGFPYDAMVFVTPSLALKAYPRFGKIRVFGSTHIPKIVSHAEHLLEEISKA